MNQLNSEITSLKKEVLKLKQENTELKDTIVFNTAVVHSNSDDDSDNDVTPPPNEDSKSNKQSELKQELQKVTQDRDSLLKENQELSSNFELFQTKAVCIYIYIYLQTKRDIDFLSLYVHRLFSAILRLMNMTERRDRKITCKVASN